MSPTPIKNNILTTVFLEGLNENEPEEGFPVCLDAVCIDNASEFLNVRLHFVQNNLSVIFY